MRFCRICIYTSQILQLEERPWSVSTDILSVREPFRHENRGAATPVLGRKGGSPGAMRRETERLGAATQPFSNPHSEDNDDLF